MIERRLDKRRGEKQRVAIFAERFPAECGGISTAHEGLGCLLAQRYEVKRFAFEPSRQKSSDNVERTEGNALASWLFSTALAWQVRRYDGPVSANAARKIGATVSAVRQLNRPLKQFKPDVIIVSDDQVPLLGMTIPKAARVVWVAHHNYLRFLNQRFIPIASQYDLFFAHRLERRAARKCDFAVFPSNYMEKVFRETLNERVRGCVIRNVLPPLPALPERTAVREEIGMADAGPGIFFPSGGTDVKGARFVPELIRRMQHRVPGAFFIISGPIYQTLSPELELMRSRHRIIAEGAVSRERALRLAVACDICVSPSILENYSCALLECQSLGLPVVTFRVGGNDEIVENGASGWLIDFGDIDQMVISAVEILLSADLRQRMSEGARRRAQSLASPSSIMAAWEDVFEQLELGARVRGGIY